MALRYDDSVKAVHDSLARRTESLAVSSDISTVQDNAALQLAFIFFEGPKTMINLTDFDQVLNCLIVLK